ncbi:aminoglycoside phosphotransferase family protein [Xenophilus sp. Marseille-Q4582]|uniref:aminoglycoside phosphotransferase family protein n=1 Tax=Xenophilus sp. Marseille-Q4582 TaxID=2866600 RepID=UPI001CE43CBB|nr:phosphotransferase [Xenophilus sp. Marseille-Q4582]
MTAFPPPAAGLSSPSVAWSDPARAASFSRWIEAIAAEHRLRPETLRLASADASFRRYLRIDTHTDGLARIVMDAPPDKEDSRPFVQVAGLMQGAGVRAPQVLAWNEAEGFLLLDDLGARTLLDGIQPDDPAANLPRYQQAIDALVRWQMASRPGVLPPYDAALLRRELQLFPDWYLGRHRGVQLGDKQRAVIDRAFAVIVENNLSSASVFVHRDFMPRNLMLTDEATLGVLDFQDAVYGPITYDIASLMRDAFLSWDESFVLDVTVRYWQAARKAGLPVHEDFGDFYRAVEWMGLQRHLKVAGIFARLTLRDGKPRYLADTPRFIAYIRATAGRYRELMPLLRLIDEIEGTTPQVGFAYGRV